MSAEAGWEELRRAAEWLVSIHADDVSIPKGSALWEDLQSLKVALAAARGEPPAPQYRIVTCPHCDEELSVTPGESERQRRDEAHALGYREGYRAALATPTTPEPDQ